MAGECVTSLTEDQFEEVVRRNSGTVLVDFYTAWCPPCKQVAPVIEQLCAENRATLKVVKMDAEENPNVAAEFRVSAVPTFVLFHAGKKVGQITGAQPKASFEKWIAACVSGTA